MKQLVETKSYTTCWDATRAAVRRRFYYLYRVIDIWSRKTIGWSVHESEDSELAATLVRNAAMRERVDHGEHP